MTTFRQQVSNYAAGGVSNFDLPEIAQAALEEGLESPSLATLAGMSRLDDPYELIKYLEKSLDELDIPMPDRVKATNDYVAGVIDQIIDGQVDVVIGAHKIFQAALHNFDYFPKVKKYAYDNFGLEKAYGLLDTCDELPEADHPWDKDKTNEELLVEAREHLLEELKRWRERYAKGQGIG